jgi:hypothetical protein
MDYKNGKIYAIHNTEDDLVYVGSTASTLVKRFSGHKNQHTQERFKNYPLYKHMNELGFDKFYIKLVEEFPCENRTELCAREGVWIREMGTLNGRIEGRTQKEWYNDNREAKLVYLKDYRSQNRDARLKYFKKYKEDHREKIREKQYEKIECPCGGRFTYAHKSEHLKSKIHMNYIANQQNSP